MAKIVGAIGSSHAPSIAYAYDSGHGERPEWKGLFEAFAPVSQWIKDVQADTLLFVYNDHLNNFKFNNYPSFALGTGDLHQVFGEGKVPRPLPAVPGNSGLAWQIARGLVADEFDPSLCLDMALDHGVMSVLPLLAPPPWGLKVIPLAVNVVLEPMPSPKRCWKLGLSIAKAVASAPSDARVVVIATGGLSHQLHGGSFGVTNPTWDQRFLDLLETDPETLSTITHQELIDRGGAEAVEMMVWLTMRASLGTNQPLRKIQRYYDAPKLTGYGLLALQPINQYRSP